MKRSANRHSAHYMKREAMLNKIWNFKKEAKFVLSDLPAGIAGFAMLAMIAIVPAVLR